MGNLLKGNIFYKLKKIKKHFDKKSESNQFN